MQQEKQPAVVLFSESNERSALCMCMSCILVNNLSSINQARTHRPFDPSVGGVQGGKQTIGAFDWCMSCICFT